MISLALTGVNLKTFSTSILFSLAFGVFSDAAFAQAAPRGPSTFESMIPLVLVVVIMYFLMIRPQQKRMKEHQTFLNNMKPGDEVVTTGGIIGRIKSIQDTFVSVEIANETIVKIVKSEISRSTKQPAAQTQPAVSTK